MINENGISNAATEPPAASTYAPATNHMKADDDIHMFDIDGEHSEAINVIGDTAIVENNDVADEDYGNVPATFKKPLEPLNSGSSSSVGRPTRELISCIMTTSGFISPAREGKLPDAKKPIVILEEEPPVRPPPPPVDVKPSANDLVDRKLAGNARADDSASAADPKSENPNGEPSFAASGGDADDVKPFKTNVPPLSVDADGVSVKKKLKHYTDADAMSLKEIKKARKLSQSKSAKMASAKNRKLSKVLNKLLIKPSKRNALLLESGAALGVDGFGTDMSNLSDEEIRAIRIAKKKLKLQQSLKRKHKKEMLLKQSGSKQMLSADGTIPQKQRKKREPKIPKREQSNFPSTSSYAYGGDNVAPVHHMRPHSSQEMLNVHQYGNDSSSMGVDKEESMDMIGGEHQHFDKLSNEPDKRKLNIFKKISTPSSSTIHLASQSILLDSNSPIVRKSSKTHSDTALWPSADQSQQALTPVKTHDSTHSTPLFSDPALLTSMPYPADIVSGKKTKLKGMGKVPKPPKIPKEKKLKKDLTQRKPRTPKASKSFPAPNHPVGYGPLQPPPMTMPPDVGSSRMPMPMFPNMGFLDQFSGPGLIPSNPLFQSVPFGIQNQMPPFLPNYNDLLNFSRFKRPNFDDTAPAGLIDPHRNPSHNIRHETIKDDPNASMADKSVKPLCHVAPFVPPSLLSNESIALHSSQQKDLHRNPMQKTEGIAMQGHSMEPNGAELASQHDKYGRIPATQRSNAPIYDDQKTTIIIDSDDDDDPSNDRRFDSPVTSNAAPSDRDGSQFSDESKRHTKKIKDKSSTGHNKKDKKDKDGSGIKMKKKKDKKDKTKSKSNATVVVWTVLGYTIRLN